MPRKYRSYTVCPNCGQKVEKSNFCSNCGQPNRSRNISLKQFISDFFGDYFTFDSKLFRSLFPLVSRPGHLTNEYIEGRRANYILPLRLYIFTTFLFFFIITMNNKINEFSMDKMPPDEVWASRDSIADFLSSRNPEISEDNIWAAAGNLDNNFEIQHRTSENNSFFTDTLKTILANEKYNLDDTVLDWLSRDLNANFTFVQMDKESRAEAVQQMQDVINVFAAHIDSTMRDSIIADVDESYFFTSSRKGPQHVSIIIFGKEDSARSGFGKYLESKIRKITARGDEGELRFLAEMLNQVPKVMFLLLPVFALLLKLFYIRRKIFYINHLIFSLHLHTLLFIYLLIPILFTRWYILLLFFTAIVVNTYIAFLNVYRQGKIKTFFKMNLIMCIYTFIIMLSITLLVFLAIFNI